jgi:hypothetical protein
MGRSCPDCLVLRLYQRIARVLFLCSPVLSPGYIGTSVSRAHVISPCCHPLVVGAWPPVSTPGPRATWLNPILLGRYDSLSPFILTANNLTD